MKSKHIIILSLVVAVIALLGIYYWQTHKQAEAPIITGTSQDRQKAQNASLGADIITQVQNPVENQVPETNPIKDSYRNPFE